MGYIVAQQFNKIKNMYAMQSGEEAWLLLILDLGARWL
jgi:hypothetical protein